ncbi:MAG: hydrogenase maturation nickel metallochaperone HypA [Pseudomonadota bacterium]|jgi:hydrogenase nickel incorporation protein HypA/HybF|uniref:Hydrogenase maturation factor HypA n=1 Tax=Thiothrix fructosivorans TaxID=111770 RepID=A0A8B0SQS3_9GAMM|nr:hydrogenase maturation nickel metallochaperone HypA [Thiothrix fructosivorans]MBO0613312.1 hydrogenase maturation nickel metallochaperone HypA [Thiothrix fructosivorans]QTX11252.1 hydrogenase maturation nickel metallochaperone HypA [Thiothrix fructosivorans]
MHEMSLCEGVLQIIETEAKRQQFRKVKTVWLAIGVMSGVEIEAMRFCFDVIVRNTLADGATLEIIEVPAEAWCLECAQTVSIQQRYDACPHCGSYQLQVTSGEEMRIKELEVE